MNLVAKRHKNNVYKYHSQYRTLLLISILFLIFSLLLSCLTTPEENEDSQDEISTESKNSDSGSKESTKKTETGSTNSTESGKTKTTGSVSHENNPGLGELFGINFTTFWGEHTSPAKEESTIYIIVYVVLFVFVYLAIMIRIIRRKRKKG